MESLSNPDVWIALLTLSAMEIVLGIDNIVFLSILVSRLPEEQRAATRRIGLLGALITRLALLFAIGWIMRLTEPFVTILEHTFSGKDLVLLFGGLFLLFKATHEIHGKLEGGGEEVGDAKRAVSSRTWIVLQIMVIDVVFSLDSVITAVGMADQVWVMVVAMLLAVGVMMLAAGSISDFVERHPTVKMLALSFLLLIGVMLVAEGMGRHIEKGYIYFAMGFSLFVELLNIRRTKKNKPVDLRSPYEEPT